MLIVARLITRNVSDQASTLKVASFTSFLPLCCIRMDCEKGISICATASAILAEAAFALEATTPDSTGEDSNSSLGYCTSRRMFKYGQKLPYREGISPSADYVNPQTACGSIHDALAVDPVAADLSSLCKRCNEQLRISVVRSLQFVSPFGNERNGRPNDDPSDEQFLNNIYHDLLDAIMAMQKEHLLEGLSKNSKYFSDGYKTPPSASRVSEPCGYTCPGAPVKPARISRHVNSELCRKLF